MSLGSLLTRVAHAIFDPSRPSRRQSPVAVEPPRNPSPPAAGAAPDQATGLVKLAEEVGALPAAVIAGPPFPSAAHPNQPLVIPADQVLAGTPLLRRQYTPRSMLN